MNCSKILKNSYQREITLESLRIRFDHPSADMVYTDVKKIIPHISLSTVYRNLEVLNEMGLVQKIDIGSGIARYDGNQRPHYHAICVKCSRVDDVPDDAITIFKYDYRKIAGFDLSFLNMQFFGICHKCREKQFLASNKTGEEQVNLFE